MRRSSVVVVGLGLLAAVAVSLSLRVLVDEQSDHPEPITFAVTDTPAPSSEAGRRRSGRDRTDRGVETVSGRVLLSGRPRRGARVWVDGVETETDEHGRFEVPNRPRGKHTILYGGGDHLAQEVEVTGNQPVNLRLRWPRKREGRLVLPDGVATEGVTVIFRVRRGKEDQRVRVSADGTFHHERLQPFGHDVIFPSQLVGGRAFYRKSVLAGRFSNDPTVLEPIAGAVISGRVVDAAGRPVSDTLVGARGKWPRASMNALAGDRTSDDGRFELIVPAGVESSLTASAPGDGHRGNRHHTAAVWKVEPPADGVEIELPRGRTVTGVLLDPSGEPIPDAAIRFRELNHSYSWVAPVKARTDRTGAFVAAGLSPRDLRVRFDGRESADRELLLDARVPAKTADVVLRTLPSLRLRGRIERSAETEGKSVRFGFASTTGSKNTDVWRRLRKNGEFDIGFKAPGRYTVRVLIGKSDRRTCGTIVAGAEPVKFTIPAPESRGLADTPQPR